MAAQQTPERQALAEISMICSEALSHGADAAGVVEILEAISEKARAPQTSAVEDLLGLARSFQIGRLTVAWRADDLWAVEDCGSVLSSDGEWLYEPLPSNRTDEFKAKTRFDRDAAIGLAKKLQEGSQ